MGFGKKLVKLMNDTGDLIYRVGHSNRGVRSGHSRTRTKETCAWLSDHITWATMEVK